MPVQKTTREEILEKAIDVFGRQGYHRTSMHDLAATCGLLKGSFYHYFSSKEALMEEVLRYSLDYFRKHIFSVARRPDLPPGERLRTMLEKSSVIILRNNQGCMFGNTVLETANVLPQFRETTQAFFADWTDALAHIYTSKYDPPTALEQARQTVMEVEGAIMLTKLCNDPQLLVGCRERVLKRFAQPGGTLSEQPTTHNE
ncbi:MAG: TetR/AcrR family transcriptional regulator [Cytophagales bacterium]|nr:TetR/AcrR family transcriptional regulator [Cytophagales bacterium]